MLLSHQIKSYLAAKQGLHFSSGFHVEVKLSVVDNSHERIFHEHPEERSAACTNEQWNISWLQQTTKCCERKWWEAEAAVTSRNVGRELPVQFQAETTAARVWRHAAAAAERWQESLIHKSGITTQRGAQSRWWLSAVWSGLGTGLVELGWAIVFKMCNVCSAPCSKTQCLELQQSYWFRQDKLKKRERERKHLHTVLGPQGHQMGNWDQAVCSAGITVSVI